jgi:hypothetical protein
MADNPPYIAQPGMITKALEKIQTAATPPRFTQDFLATVLKMKGGNARQVIPYLKKVGFLSSDGTPTDLYVQYRNPAKSGAALGAALKIGYSSLYEANEYVHELSDKDLKGLVVEVTGLKPQDRVVESVVACYKRLREGASFEETLESVASMSLAEKVETQQLPSSTSGDARSLGMNLSYTINLNLPATADVEVFNAIFKSLKENLLKD